MQNLKIAKIESFVNNENRQIPVTICKLIDVAYQTTVIVCNHTIFCGWRDLDFSGWRRLKSRHDRHAQASRHFNNAESDNPVRMPSSIRRA